MWIRTGIICVSLLAVAADKPTAKSDQDEIQGEWKVISGEHDGQSWPDDLVKMTMVTFEGNKMSIDARNKQQQPNEAKFKLDPTKTPKWIDIDMKGNPGVGIYSLESDTLKLCFREGKDARPTEFATKTGAKNILLVLKRAK
jgi:uncharacterized protein (TIGR03067 family)